MFIAFQRQRFTSLQRGCKGLTVLYMYHYLLFRLNWVLQSITSVEMGLFLSLYFGGEQFASCVTRDP